MGTGRGGNPKSRAAGGMPVGSDLAGDRERPSSDPGVVRSALAIRRSRTPVGGILGRGIPRTVPVLTTIEGSIVVVVLLAGIQVMVVWRSMMTWVSALDGYYSP
jgi:hypothetical protein